MTEKIFKSGTNKEIKEFEFVFKSYYVRLTLFANKFLNDLEVSEEIASEALTVLWENRETILCISNTAYLHKIVRNKCMNYIKHQKVENEYINYMIRNNLLNELPEHFTDSYQQKELTAQIKLAIDSLPLKCRQVFEMSRFENLKNREIADKLNISQNTVERHMTIALQRLRKNLEYITLMGVCLLKYMV